MSEENQGAMCLSSDNAPRTWRDRMRNKLFPVRHCFAPDAPSNFKDCVTVRAVSTLSWVDRLRILWTGIVVTHVRTVTEHEVGDTRTAAECYAGTSRDLRQ
jgi:hypothetical protein